MISFFLCIGAFGQLGCMPFPVHVASAFNAIVQRSEPEAKRPAEPKALLARLKSESVDIRLAAAREAGKTKDELTLDYLIVALAKEESLAVKKELCRAIGQFGPAGKNAIPSLISAFVSDKSYTQGYTVCCSGTMTTDCVTSYAANALVNIGSDAAIAIGDILLDENRNATIRMNAAYALHAMEKKAYPSLPFVVAATTVKDKNVRRLAVGLLPRIAPKSIESRRTLLGALADQNSEVVIEAASALFSMDNRNVISVPVLVEQLEKGDARAKASSADALGKIGTAAKSAIPSLAEAAKSTDVGTTISCLSAMIDIGHFTPEVFNAAFLANQHNNHNVRALAKTLLEKIKAKS